MSFHKRNAKRNKIFILLRFISYIGKSGKGCYPPFSFASWTIRRSSERCRSSSAFSCSCKLALDAGSLTWYSPKIMLS